MATYQHFDNGNILVTDHGYGVEVLSRGHKEGVKSFWLQGDDYVEFMDFVDSFVTTLWPDFYTYLRDFDYDTILELHQE
jgi:hypothetical protein